MTLDEAIQRENKIAEENHKIVDTEIVFDDISLSQLYCDDTEVIEEHLSNYRKCAEYHDQLAEWLEELKFLKQWKSDIMDNFCKYDASSFEELVTNARNKAIDDYMNKLCNHCMQQTNECYKLECPFCTDGCDIVNISEQLKAGITND